jgi:hypothetical protein
MQTDITLANSERCLVIEAKYHQRPFDRIRWGEREVVKAGHLYQLFAYLKNIAARGGCYQDAQGVLLYAAGFDAPSRGIHHDLLALAGLRSPSSRRAGQDLAVIGDAAPRTYS